MRQMNRRTTFALAFFLVVSVSGLRVASSAFTPSIDRWVIAVGGDTSTGSGYSLSGTAGQIEAGPALTGSGYQLTSGFWFMPGHSQVYLPVVLR